MARKFWKTQKFKALQTEWEEKLRKSGFVDIEDDKRRLKQSATNCYRTTTQTIIESKRRYYELLGQGYHQETEFKDTVERIVMFLRSKGFKIKDICFGLKSIKKRNHRQTIRLIIRHYEIKWKIKRHR